MTMNSLLKRELTGFDLKIIALITMAISHIYEFFSFTDRVPTILDYIGTIAEPLFLFMIVEGFIHTSNRAKYILRMYLLGSFMAMMNIVTLYLFPRVDGMSVSNNIIYPYVMILIFLSGVSIVKEKKLKGISLMLLPFLGDIFIYFLYYVIVLTGMRTKLDWLFMAIVRFNPFTLNFGEIGLGGIIGALLLYLLRDKRKARIWSYCGFNALWVFVDATLYYDSFMSIHGPSYFIASFAMQFVVLWLLFMYKGQRGLAAKRLFYIFYPAHIYLLYALSIWVYNII